MIIAAALLLALQSSGRLQGPPPPVMMSGEQERSFLARLPSIKIDGRRFRVFAIVGTGAREVLDRAATKLSAEGWKCDVAINHSGTIQLAAFGENQTLADVQKLAKRFAAHEFGTIEAKPLLFPEQN